MKDYQAILIAISTAIAAQTGVRPHVPMWAPPPVLQLPKWPHSTIPKPIITQITVAGYPIQLEDSQPDVVATRLKVTTGHRGDAGESLAWLCLHGMDKEGPWGLWPIAVYLGMTETQVQAVLGKPSSRLGDAAIYVHEHGLRLQGEPYTADNSVILTFKKGVLWQVIVHDTISS